VADPETVARHPRGDSYDSQSTAGGSKARSKPWISEDPGLPDAPDSPAIRVRPGQVSAVQPSAFPDGAHDGDASDGAGRLKYGSGRGVLGWATTGRGFNGCGRGGRTHALGLRGLIGVSQYLIQRFEEKVFPPHHGLVDGQIFAQMIDAPL